MNDRHRFPAVLILSSLATAVLAGELPSEPAELGSIRRNERGQLEVFKAPAETPSGAAAPGVVPEALKRAAPGQPPAPKDRKSVV